MSQTYDPILGFITHAFGCTCNQCVPSHICGCCGMLMNMSGHICPGRDDGYHRQRNTGEPFNIQIAQRST